MSSLPSAVLAAAMADARARWPELCDTPASRTAFEELVGRLGAGDDPGTLALPDLYLVAGCLVGDPGALVALERMIRAEAIGAAGRARGLIAADDLAQELWLKLAVPNDGKPPRLATFGGYGPLGAWLRVAAIRTAISLTRGRREAALDDDAMAVIADDADDQALAFLKQSYRVEFKRAFADALAGLPKRSRTLLRLHVLDQLSVDEIGAFYQVSRATGARWLADARRELVASTQARLTAQLALAPDELAELMRLVASTLYATLPRLLGQTSSS